MLFLQRWEEAREAFAGLVEIGNGIDEALQCAVDMDLWISEARLIQTRLQVQLEVERLQTLAEEREQAGDRKGAYEALQEAAALVPESVWIQQRLALISSY